MHRHKGTNLKGHESRSWCKKEGNDLDWKVNKERCQGVNMIKIHYLDVRKSQNEANYHV